MSTPEDTAMAEAAAVKKKAARMDTAAGAADMERAAAAEDTDTADNM